jgi:hypothetical protein
MRNLTTLISTVVSVAVWFAPAAAAKLLVGHVDSQGALDGNVTQDGCTKCNGYQARVNRLSVTTHESVHDKVEVHMIAVYEGFRYEERRPEEVNKPYNGAFLEMPTSTDRRAEQYKNPGRVIVRISASHPMNILVLSSYDPVAWTIECEPGARVSQIIMSGYQQQRLESAPAGVEVRESSHGVAPKGEQRMDQPFDPFFISFASEPGPTGGLVPNMVEWVGHNKIGSQAGNEGYDALRQYIKNLTGHELKSFRARRCGCVFNIN